MSISAKDRTNAKNRLRNISLMLYVAAAFVLGMTISSLFESRTLKGFKRFQVGDTVIYSRINTGNENFDKGLQNFIEGDVGYFHGLLQLPNGIREDRILEWSKKHTAAVF